MHVLAFTLHFAHLGERKPKKRLLTSHGVRLNSSKRKHTNGHWSSSVSMSTTKLWNMRRLLKIFSLFSLFFAFESINIYEESESIIEAMSASDPSCLVTKMITRTLEERISKLFVKAKTAECRATIATHFSHFLEAFGNETSFPFLESRFENTCPEYVYNFDKLPRGITVEDIMNRTYQPPRDNADYIDNPEELRLLYGILTHEHPQSTIRLIEALYEDGHLFVIHVDGKSASDDTYNTIVEYAKGRPYIHLVPDRYRVRVNWGGFSMVNATLQMLQYAFALLHDSPLKQPLEFHKFVHLSSSTYPIRSNYEIKRRVASYPLDANLVNVILSPVNPSRTMWHYYVECDDAVHRIYQLHPLSAAVNGVDIFVSSQWFIISRPFAEYLAKAEKGTFVHDYLEYIQHVVVADESFFGTVLRNTEFCVKHHNFNLLHYSFDRWENEVDTQSRDPRKCVHPNPDHCGRSPAIMNMDYFNVMDLSNDLFARKFSDDEDSVIIKSALDKKRENEEQLLKKEGFHQSLKNVKSNVDLTFEGQGVLLVAKESLISDSPLCMGLGSKANKVKLVPCFYDAVLSTLELNWETGAVIEEEIIPNNRWEIGPCSSDGTLTRMDNGTVRMVPGEFSEIGPSCMLKQLGGIRNGRCLDVESERVEPGGQLQVYPCLHKWHQTFSFGDGTMAPSGAIHTTVPRHIVHSVRKQGKNQSSHLCVGVLCRSSLKPEIWDEDLRQGLDFVSSLDFVPKKVLGCRNLPEKLSLDLWKFKNLVTVPCTDVDNVIEFLVVPFIREYTESTILSKEEIYDSSRNEL